MQLIRACSPPAARRGLPAIGDRRCACGGDRRPARSPGATRLLTPVTTRAGRRPCRAPAGGVGDRGL